MKLPILFRGRDEHGNWHEGSLVVDINQQCSIINYANHKTECYTWHDVIPETVGQLRYQNKFGKYFDGDIYMCAGFGLDIVSAYCEITDRIMYEGIDDIGEIFGNIHDNPSLLSNET